MPNEITLNSAQNTGSKTIFVDHGVMTGATNQQIIFKNALQSPTRDVEIMFFAQDATADQKKDVANAIAGFCTELGSSKTLTVDEGSNAGGSFTPGSATCTLAKGNDVYQYTITAGNPYEVLDPIIIVEGGGVRPLIRPEFQLPVVIIGLALIALAAYLGYKRGLSAGSSN